MMTKTPEDSRVSLDPPANSRKPPSINDRSEELAFVICESRFKRLEIVGCVEEGCQTEGLKIHRKGQPFRLETAGE